MLASAAEMGPAPISGGDTRSGRDPAASGSGRSGEHCGSAGQRGQWVTPLSHRVTGSPAVAPRRLSGREPRHRGEYGYYRSYPHPWLTQSTTCRRLYREAMTPVAAYFTIGYLHGLSRCSCRVHDAAFTHAFQVSPSRSGRSGTIGA